MPDFKRGDKVRVRALGGAGFWWEPHPRSAYKGYATVLYIVSDGGYGTTYAVLSGRDGSVTEQPTFAVDVRRLVPYVEEPTFEYRTVTCAKDYRHALDEGWEYDCDKGNDIQMKRKVK